MRLMSISIDFRSNSLILKKKQNGFEINVSVSIVNTHKLLDCQRFQTEKKEIYLYSIYYI